MEALVPAFIAALLTQIGDRPASLTAILADRFGRPVTIAVGAGLAHALLSVFAALAAELMAPSMTPNARALFVAIALLFGGVASLFPVRPPNRLEEWRIGSFLTALLGVFSLALGGQTQFFTLAFAVRGDPWFAVVGATLGAFAVALVAAVLGESTWAKLKFRAFRAAIGILCLIAGIIMGLGALRLI
jgi:hypothetical protein